MDENLKRLLSSIIPGDLESAKAAFKNRAVLARRLDEDDEDDDQEENNSLLGNEPDEELEDDVESSILDSAINKIENYESYLDSVVGQRVLKTIETSIVSQPSAITAVFHYTKDWFINLPCSYNLKREVAGLLIERIKPYYNYKCSLWESIRDGDPEVLLDVSYQYGVS